MLRETRVVIENKRGKSVKRIVSALTYYGKYSTWVFHKIAFPVHEKPMICRDFSATMTTTCQTATKNRSSMLILHTLISYTDIYNDYERFT